MNCTREFLVRDYAALLPKDRVVIEILETVRIDDELIAACRDLKHAGYQIALDDFRDPRRNGSLWSRLRTSSKWMCWRQRLRSNCGWPGSSREAAFG